MNYNQDHFNDIFANLPTRSRKVKINPTFTDKEKHHGSKEKNPSKKKA